MDLGDEPARGDHRAIRICLIAIELREVVADRDQRVLRQDLTRRREHRVARQRALGRHRRRRDIALDLRAAHRALRSGVRDVVAREAAADHECRVLLRDIGLGTRAEIERRVVGLGRVFGVAAEPELVEPRQHASTRPVELADVAEAAFVAMFGERLRVCRTRSGRGRRDRVDEEVRVDEPAFAGVEQAVEHRLHHARRALLVVDAAHRELAIRVRGAGEQGEDDERA